MLSLMSKTPKIEYSKPDNYSGFNDYQKDACYLVELIKQSYPRLNTKIPQDDFLTLSNNLIQNVGSVTNPFEFEVLLQKYIANLKDGHSSVSSISLSLMQDENYFSWYLFKEKDDWFIYLIDKSLQSSIVGSKVIAINDFSMDEVMEKVGNFESGENHYYQTSTFETRVMHPKYWVALGLSETEKEIHFSIEQNGEIKKYQLTSKPVFDCHENMRPERKYPFSKKQNEGFSYEIGEDDNFAYLQMNTSLDYITYKSELKNYTNFFFRPFAKMYLKKDTKDARNFGLVLQSLFEQIHQKEIDNLIIDLRHNNGGDERLGKQLIWYLTEEVDINGFTDYIHISDFFKKTAKVDYETYNNLYQTKYNKSIPKGEINLTEEFFYQAYFDDITKTDSPYLLDETIPKFDGNVFVIIGPNTFSAGQVLATTIADNKLGKIVGTPLGNKPSTQTGASVLKLPNTKTILSLSYFYFERPDKSKNHENSLFPDIEIYQTYEDLMDGVDSTIDLILTNKK